MKGAITGIATYVLSYEWHHEAHVGVMCMWVHAERTEHAKLTAFQSRSKERWLLVVAHL